MNEEREKLARASLYGEWTVEPDNVQWVDEHTGLPCCIIRNKSGGNLCGYVGVPKNHKFYKLCYDDSDEISEIRVHGGLTFASYWTKKFCGYRHGEYWWFGFDCAHHMDFVPGHAKFSSIRGGTYKNVDYVRAECAGLAAQLI